jgi:thiamine kinase-like enzyme
VCRVSEIEHVSAPPDWLCAVAAAHEAGSDAWATDHATVRRVRGGANNALYQVQAGGRRYACKLCVADERRRARREYGSLCMLHAAGLDIAPTPVWLDESCSILPFPTVVYEWLPGTPLSGSPTAPQLAALLDTIQRLHDLRRDDFAHHDLPHAIFHWFDFAPYLRELRDFLARYGSWLGTTVPDGRDLLKRLVRLVDTCTEAVAAAAVDPSRDRFSLRLCRVDPNLVNTVWGTDGRLRWVDWEYSGWGDPALDMADLRWHAALADLGQAQHAWLRDRYRQPSDDPGFVERLATWDRVLATRWPLLVLRALWSVHNGPDRVRLTQLRADPSELRMRLIRFVVRAEGFARSQNRDRPVATAGSSRG